MYAYAMYANVYLIYHLIINTIAMDGEISIESS